jgi:hypothetical protein
MSLSASLLGQGREEVVALLNCCQRVHRNTFHSIGDTPEMDLPLQ